MELPTACLQARGVKINEADILVAEMLLFSDIAF